MNRPYLSESATTYNENLYNSVPARFGNKSILVNHGLHKNVTDSTSTSIVGQPQQPQFNWNPVNNPWICQQPAQIVPQKHLIPEGVIYTFQPAVQNYALRNYVDPNCNLNPNQNSTNAFIQQPMTLQQQIAFNELQKHALEAMLLHEQFKENPFKLQFHKDGQTNTDEINICMCKKTLLNPLQNEPQCKIGQPANKPEQLFPEIVKQKQLRLNTETGSNFEDKSVQSSPMQESVEVQADTIKHCVCRRKTKPTQDNETTTKKVTFDEVNEAPTREHKCKRKTPPAKRHRQVDEDSSDSSGEHSSLSKSSDESI